MSEERRSSRAAAACPSRTRQRPPSAAGRLSTPHSSRAKPVHWTRRHRGLVVALAAAALATAVVLVAVLTPSGQAVVDRFRDAVGRRLRSRRWPACLHRGASSSSRRRRTVGRPQDGSKRLLGEYDDASWSPRGSYVVAAKGQAARHARAESGDVRWSLSRAERRCAIRGGPAGGSTRGLPIRPATHSTSSRATARRTRSSREASPRRSGLARRVAYARLRRQ